VFWDVIPYSFTLQKTVNFKIIGCEIYKYSSPWPAAGGMFLKNIALGKRLEQFAAADIAFQSPICIFLH
jgi:hypothetical protein